VLLEQGKLSGRLPAVEENERHGAFGVGAKAFRIARRKMGVVKMNLGFSALYNLVGLSLAAFGFLPPVLAAAAQSLPDLGIMANSSRLLRQK